MRAWGNLLLQIDAGQFLLVAYVEPAVGDDGGAPASAAKRGAAPQFLVGGHGGVDLNEFARFAGEGASEKARNRKLFKMLKNVPMHKRQARYRCVIALVNPQGQELGVVQGTCSGYITTKELGSNGFGFDPLFLLKRYNKTFGQLPPSLKAKISHRARALKKFRLLLDQLL